MKAYVVEKGQLALKEVADPELKTEDDVIVNLHASGLNRRDLMISKRAGDKADYLILGSDGAGVIESVGKNVENLSVGQPVIINPSLRWSEKSLAPPAEFDILGFPDHGTFAEKIVIDQNQIEVKPGYLSFESASVVALAALTGYRALVTQGDIQAGQTLFLPGAGSGVANFIIPFAKAKGAKVIVSSRSEFKREKALEIGADIAIDTNADWLKALENETIDLIIDSVGAATFNRSLDVLKKGGRIVVFGATTDDVVDFDLRKFFYGQYQLFGSTMGSREELRAALALMESHQIQPSIDKVFDQNEFSQAMEYLKDTQQFGKITVKWR